MKKKRALTLIMMAAMVSGLTACGSRIGAEVETEGSVTVMEVDIPDGTSSIEEADPDEEYGDEGEDEEALWVNFDDMRFYAYGEWYELGVSTVQDMIDGGIPFTDISLEATDDVLEADYQTDLTITLDNGWSAYIYALNDLDRDASVRDCHVTKIYVPLQAAEDNIQFDFPFDMSESELIERADEADDVSVETDENDIESTTYRYTRPGKIYAGDNSYEFLFTDGLLCGVTLEYIP